MSSSQTDPDETEAAEPVDAEFEPAPDGAPKPAGGGETDTPKRGAGWFKVSLFVIAAAAIGGGSGWVAGQVLHAPVFGGGDSDLDARITALESADPAVTQSELDALQVRIGALEEAQNASGLRADAVEQLVRDVASLRDRVEALENAPVQSGAEAGETGAGGVSAEALTALEMRMAEAFDEAETRLRNVEEAVNTTQRAAEEARSAAQQALNAAGASGADQTASGEGPEVSALRAALTQLEQRQRTLAEEVAGLAGLPDRIAALEDGAAASAELESLRARVSSLAADLDSLEQTARNASAASRDQSSLAVRALAYAALSEAAAGPEAFAAEYAELNRVWPQAPRQAEIAPLARTGAPTIEDLAASFPGDALRGVSGEAQTYFGVLRIRRGEADGPAAAIEAALAADDLEAALEIANGLEGEAAAAVADWRAQAQARMRLETALQAMVQALRAEQEGAP
ncbi:MAG: hypothetical protein NXI12_05890 [Alphaproteobacteria bacterium]|nr:hypothetical protein [Alphaproteobacteria bacterium]